MNWYKKADHNYDPNWDYDVNESPDPKFKNMAENYISKLIKELIPKLDIFQNILINYVNLESSTLAKYINGTYSEPYIVVDLDNIIDTCKEYEVPIETGIETSILHELGHAIQEASELSLNEEEAEEFARVYFYTNQIYKFWEKDNNTPPFPRSLTS